MTKKNTRNILNEMQSNITTGEQYSLAKKQLASRPSTDPEVLDKLARRDDAGLAERVAENPQTTEKTLEDLSNHQAPEVRSAVAENAKTPIDTIKQLANDENPDVRFRLAENATTPVEVLETLEDDENPYVVKRAKQTLDSVRSLAERADSAMIHERFGEAENLYVQLAGDLEKLLGPSHEEIASTFHKLAAALAAQGREDEALEAERRAESASH